MDWLPSSFLALSLFAIGYGAGSQHARLLAWVRSKNMAGKPNGPRPPGRYVRQQLADIDLDAGAIDRKLERLAETDIAAAQSQGLARRIQTVVARLLGLGVDDGEPVPQNGEHQ